MTSAHRGKILIGILTVLLYIFKSLFDLKDFNQDINSTFSDFVVCAWYMEAHLIESTRISVVWDTEVGNNLCSLGAYGYLGGMTSIRNIRQTLEGILMEEEIACSP